MAFSPSVEGNKIADIFPFGTLCKFLEQVSSVAGAKKKRDYISLFMQRWADKYREVDGSVGSTAGGLGSFFPVLRLLIPSSDRTRPAYGVGESTMARMLIKAFGLAPRGSDATRMLKKDKVLLSKRTTKEDLADIVQCVLHDHCATESSYTISV